MTDNSTDPIVERRAQLAAVVRASKRFGYGLLGVAIIAFTAGAISGFPQWTVTVAIIGLVGSSIVLPVPIVLGYGIRKAEREDPATGQTRT